MRHEKIAPTIARHLPPATRMQSNAAPRDAGKKSIENALIQAKAHYDRGEARQAEALCAAVLLRDPRNAEALLLAGSLARGVGDLGLALSFYKRAAARQPQSAEMHLLLAAAYSDAREYDSEIEHLQRALALNPGLHLELGALGRAYTAAGKADLALPLFEKATRLLPDHPSLRWDHAAALIALGRMEEAAELLRENISRGHRVASSYRALADTRKFSGAPPELDQIVERLDNPDLSALERVSLHHAAGKIMNDIGRYDDAVDQFQASKLASGYTYDLEAFRLRVDSLIASFTPALLKSKAGFGDPSEVPVFIVGMPRSGTTLTEQICASHPAVHGAGELTKLGLVLRSSGYVQSPDGSIKKSPQALTAAEANAMAAEYLDFVRRKSPSASRIVDKMPHNFMSVGMIALIYPNAQIIHCTRDPIDNCTSCFFNTFSEKHGYNADLKTLGLYYREYDRLMRHWKSLLPGRIHECNYETMIADQESETRRLIEFLGLPWDDACLRFFETDRSVTTPSRWQVRQPIYQTSVKRWKRYEHKIQPLIESLGDLADV